jgi:hypothetical protein
MLPSTRYPIPRPLCSVRVTGLLSSYWPLRLPDAYTPFLVVWTWGEAVPSLAPHQDLHGYRMFIVIRLDEAKTPGGCIALARARGTLLPACQKYHSARSTVCFFGVGTFTAILHRYFASSAFRCLRINHAVAATTARLDTGPVANSYPGTPSLEHATLPCRNPLRAPAPECLLLGMHLPHPRAGPGHHNRPAGEDPPAPDSVRH